MNKDVPELTTGTLEFENNQLHLALTQVEAENEVLTKRVAELESQNEDLFQQNANMAAWCEEKSQLLAWTPVAQGLPTADGAYEFVDMVDGRCRLFDLYVRRAGVWGRGGPDEHWNYTHFRPVTLPGLK